MFFIHTYLNTLIAILPDNCSWNILSRAPSFLTKLFCPDENIWCEESPADKMFPLWIEDWFTQCYCLTLKIHCLPYHFLTFLLLPGIVWYNSISYLVVLVLSFHSVTWPHLTLPFQVCQLLDLVAKADNLSANLPTIVDRLSTLSQLHEQGRSRQWLLFAFHSPQWTDGSLGLPARLPETLHG